MRRNSAAFFGKKSPSGNGGRAWSPPSAKSGGMVLDARFGDAAEAAPAGLFGWGRSSAGSHSRKKPCRE